LFDFGDHSDEAGVAVQRREVGVFFHFEGVGWIQPGVKRLSQERQCLWAISLASFDATETLNGRSRELVLRPQNAAGEVDRIPVQLLRFGVATLPRKINRQVPHRLQGRWMFRP